MKAEKTRDRNQSQKQHDKSRGHYDSADEESANIIFSSFFFPPFKLFSLSFFLFDRNVIIDTRSTVDGILKEAKNFAGADARLFVIRE